jgi:cysteinyl-tRNA synthetase
MSKILRDEAVLKDEVMVKIKIEERNKARQNRDYKLADKIRKELEEKGIILEDTKDGKTAWRRRL